MMPDTRTSRAGKESGKREAMQLSPARQIVIALLALVFVGPQTPWGWIGIVPLATALMGNCPAYSLLGIKTCKKQ